MNENRTTQRSGPGRTPTARPTIGMIAHWIEGSHQAQWLGAVDAARAQQADLITFVGRELGHPDNFYAQANVIYDLASPAYLDGLVIWTSSLPVFVGQQQAAAFCQRYRPLPMVSIGPPIAGCPSVLMPNRQGMRAAVSHLIAVHGYRRIAFIRGPANHPYAQERYQGYLDALAQHGLPHDPTLVSPPAHFWGVEEAAALAHRLLDQPSTAVEAIAAASDNLAVGALVALQARHLDAPSDMAIVGFDNITYVGPPYESPWSLGVAGRNGEQLGADIERAVNFRAPTLPLTTVQPPFYQLGFRAVELLLAQLRGEAVPEVVTVPTELIVRRSCGCFSEAVRQRAPVSRGSMPPPRPPGVSGAAVSAAQREEISAQLQQAMAPLPPAVEADWAERLVTAYLQEVQGAAPNAFLGALDALVRTSMRYGERPGRWWPGLFALRRQTLLQLATAETLARAEAVWQHVQVFMEELTERFYLLQQLLATQRDETLREIGQQLITTFDLDQLAAILAQSLPDVGIPACYLALYAPAPGAGAAVGPGVEAAGDPRAWARALLVYEGQQRIDVPDGEAVFPAQALAPGGRLRRGQPSSMVVEPLYFREQQLGFVLFEVGPREGWVYETLRSQLSSPLQGALLVEREKRALAAVEEARTRAEVANRAKSAFLANMSHELRTPQNTILGFARLLARQAALPRQAQDDLGIILRSGEHLLTLINQVLDLSKIEARRATLTATDFDLDQLLDDLNDMFAFRAQADDMRLIVERSPDAPRYVRADQVKLRQVLINLLSNALKFTAAGQVTLRVGIGSQELVHRGLHNRSVFDHEEHEGNEGSKLLVDLGPPVLGMSGQAAPPQIPNSAFLIPLRFEVADTGVGIAAEEVARLGGAFVQATAGRSAQEGTGLGLALSRSFVQLMGGELRLDSQVGRGTTVTFDIPVQLVDAGAVAEPGAAPRRQVVALAPDQPRYRLLVADDLHEARQLLVRLLATLGFAMREAGSGQEAVAIWDEWQPHLILMDLRMPGMDGIAATRHIKANARGQATTIIALTASSFEEERSAVLAAGCDDFLRKPFHEDDLFAMLHKHLGARFVYQGEPTAAGAPTAPAASALDSAALASVPASLLAALEQALNQLDTHAIDRAIAEIRLHDAAVAAALAALSQTFQYRRIVRLIRGAAADPLPEERL